MLLKFTNSSERTQFNNGKGKASKGWYGEGVGVIEGRKSPMTEPKFASILKSFEKVLFWSSSFHCLDLMISHLSKGELRYDYIRQTHVARRVCCWKTNKSEEREIDENPNHFFAISRQRRPDTHKNYFSLRLLDERKKKQNNFLINAACGAFFHSSLSYFSRSLVENSQKNTENRIEAWKEGAGEEDFVRKESKGESADAFGRGLETKIDFLVCRTFTVRRIFHQRRRHFATIQTTAALASTNLTIIIRHWP
jgi:hypothetical protein